MKTLQSIRCCDFCNDSNAKHVWLFAKQKFPAGTPVDFLLECLEHPEWFACDRCHELLTRQDILGLVQNNPQIPADRRSYFTKLYTSLIDNLRMS